MFTRKKIIEILIRQGVSELAHDAVVVAALKKAGLSDADAAQAIGVLRQSHLNAVNNFSESQKLFYTDGRLSPKMVSQLLNINVLVQPHAVHMHSLHPDNERDRTELAVAAFTIFIAFLVAMVAGVASLYIFEVGPFYVPLAEVL